MLSMLNFLGFKTEFVMLYMLFFLVFRTQNSIWGIIVCMKKHAEFSGLPCMTNMMNVLGV